MTFAVNLWGQTPAMVLDELKHPIVLARHASGSAAEIVREVSDGARQALEAAANRAL